jgi:acyl-CoA synthetase (AMP-forming)/AMP-acid ligase II
MLYIDFFDRGVENFPDRDAILDDQRSWTYREMGQLVDRIATALLAQVSPGARVAIYSPNHAYGFACQYAALRAGCIWMPLNHRNGAAATVEALGTLSVDWLFFHSSLAEHVQDAKSVLPTLKGLVALDKSSGFAECLDTWIADAPPTSFPRGRPEDSAAILLTSGTTGKPKGILLSNRAFATMIAELDIVFQHQIPPVHLVVAPITHAAGIYASTLLASGGTHILVTNPDPLSILQSIEKHRVTTLFLPPTIIYMLLAHPRVREFDYSSLRSLVYGGAPMSVEKLKEAIEIFGPVLVQGYGQSEALMMCAYLSAEDHVEALSDPKLQHRLASAGREGPLVRLAIMDDSGRILPANEPGEIVVRSDIVMDGYVDNPEATAEASAFGWHHTGDVGYKDEDGFFYIVDRKKDMIITGGFNVFPAEIEQAVLSHPSVQDCAVVGIPDPKWGEAVLAAVELKPGACFDEVGIIEHCKSRLGGVKAPKTITAVASLPRSSVGKVLRREVRAPYWVNHSRAV